jgi:SOS-response transcriptional repressor LexA
MTPAQQRVLRFISAFLHEQCRPPTYREMMDGIGMKSMSTLHKHVMRLEQQGMVSREPRRACAISVTAKGMQGDGCMIAIPWDLRVELERRAHELSEPPNSLAVKAIAAFLEGRAT